MFWAKLSLHPKEGRVAHTLQKHRESTRLYGYIHFVYDPYKFLYSIFLDILKLHRVYD